MDDPKRQIRRTVKLTIAILTFIIIATVIGAWYSINHGETGTRITSILQIHRLPSEVNSTYYLCVDGKHIASGYAEVTENGSAIILIPYVDFGTVQIRGFKSHSVWVEDSQGIKSNILQIHSGDAEVFWNFDIGDIHVLDLNIRMSHADERITRVNISVDGTPVNSDLRLVFDDLVSSLTYIQGNGTHEISVSCDGMNFSKTVQMNDWCVFEDFNLTEKEYE